MVKCVTVAQVRALEAAANAAGVPDAELMARAASAIEERVVQLAEQRGLFSMDELHVTVLVGPGNNGGDGLLAARALAARGAQVRAYLLAGLPRVLTQDDAEPFHADGVFIAEADKDRDQRLLRNMIASSHIVLDALFGVGVRLPLPDDAANLLRHVSRVVHHNTSTTSQPPMTIPLASGQFVAPAARRPYVLAVDCPSGLDCDTGQADAHTLAADETITFIAPKIGMVRGPGAHLVGDLTFATLGIDADADAATADAATSVADALSVRAMLPARPADAHKGTFGKAMIVAGSVNYSGAAGLSALGAYRAGAGLVSVAAPGPVVGAISAHLLEATYFLLPHDMGVVSEAAVDVLLKDATRYSALLLGPGLGQEATTKQFVERLLRTSQSNAARTPRRSIGFGLPRAEATAETPDVADAKLPPLVLDADALNLLAALPDWWALLPANTIITPHPGEMARLANLDADAVQADRWALAQDKAAAWQVVLVLKGANTLVAAPDGRLTVLPFREPALAKAGTGDVLAGVIVGLLAQGVPPYEAAVAGAYLHGLAGAHTAAFSHPRSVLASDVADALADAFTALGV